MENVLSLTPLVLVHKADEDSQILQHSNQWVETTDPVVSTLQAALSTNIDKYTHLFKTIAANLSSTNSYNQKNSQWSSQNTNDYITLDSIITSSMLHAEKVSSRCFSTRFDWSPILQQAVFTLRYFSLFKK
jgi:hypothetical protein